MMEIMDTMSQEEQDEIINALRDNADKFVLMEEHDVKNIPTHDEYEFNDFGKRAAPLIADILQKKMVKHRGIGLASCQIGLPFRVFAIATNPVKVCFNPKIIDVSQEEVEMVEGCLTYPGLSVKLKRPGHIRVRYSDHTGEVFTDKFTGLTARVFQHELDHLDGKDMLDRLKPLARDMALKKWKKLAKLRDARWKMGIR
jgi:peptide deformylase